MAVAYPGDTTDSVLGLYERETAAAGNEDLETGSEGDDRQTGGLLGQSLGKRSGYGTIEGDDIESGLSDDEERKRRGKRWWQVWRR